MKTNAILICGLVAGSLVVGCGDDDTTTTTSEGAGGGGGGAGGSSAGGSNTMGAPQACQICVGNVFNNNPTCAEHNTSCDEDTGCAAWKDCHEACFASNDADACYNACDQSYPHDAALGDPVLGCSCDTCASECPELCAM